MSRTPFLATNAPAGRPAIAPATLPGLLSGGLFLVTLMGEPLAAQAPEASSYPVDPTAAAGMTRGLPNGVTGQQAEMMQVRTSAQGAQGEAAAALMARSADLSIEERNQEIALQAAREKKTIKQSMSERLKFERAAASYNKVSANDMSTWKTDGGGVRVERNVPDAFLMSLIEEEEQAAAREAASGEKKGFGLFRKDSDSSDSGGSFLSSIRPPRLPFMGGGGGGNEATVSSAAAPQVSDTSEPSFARTAGSAPSQAPASAPASAPKPGVVPMISGAALVDGRSSVNPRETPAAADRTPASAQSQTVSFADATPDPARKKPGLFSKLQSEDEEDTSLVPTSSGSSGGGFFGFGKKKSAPEVGTIDAGLFPEGSASQAAIGNRLSSASMSSPSSGGDSFASASSGGVAPTSNSSSLELPGQTVEKTRGFSIPKPNLSLPSIPSIKSERGSGGNVPTMTTVNSAGTSYYVVASTAQFMVYGENQMQSEVRALPAGSVVLMTKPGEQWASVRLSNGTEGIVQNKHLRPASGAESSVEFASPAVAE